VSGAGNQQERLFIEAIPGQLGSFLAGFALGEASFMLVCRPRGDYGRRWKISAAFNVSQRDRAPLDLFRETLRCGSMRRPALAAGTGKSNRLTDIQRVIVPFFDRFPLVGRRLMTSSASGARSRSCRSPSSRTPTTPTFLLSVKE
jgi:hypothetical protein